VKQYVYHHVFIKCSAVRRPPSVVRRPSSAVRRPPSVVRRPPSVVRRPPSAVRRPPSVVRRPPSVRLLSTPIIYDANINTIQNHFGKHTNSQSFLTSLFQLNPFLSCKMKENLLGLPQLLYGTMVI
jgi:hypothetical protein